MSKNKISEKLKEDAKTAEAITELYPADWDMDAVFRKSMEKYRNAEAEQDTRSITASADETSRRRAIRFHPSRWVTAACLILTVGVFGSTGWMLLSARKAPETAPVVSETATIPIEEETVTQTEPTGTASAASGDKTVPTTASTATTATAVSSPSEAESTGTVQENTRPATDTAPQQTSSPQTSEPTVSSTVQEPLDSDTQTPGEPTVEPPGGISDTGTQPDDSVYTMKLIQDSARSTEEFYIQFQRDNGNSYTVPEEFYIDLDGYTPVMERHSETSYSRRIHRDSDTGADQDILVGISGGSYLWAVQRYSVFPQQQEILLQTQYGQCKAFLLSGGSYYKLIWYDGRYVCSLTGRPGNPSSQEELTALASAMRTH